MRKKLRSLYANYVNSGWRFSESDLLVKHRFNLINITFLLAFAGLGQGIVRNYLSGNTLLLSLELFMFGFFLFCLILLRKNRDYYDPISRVIALLTLLFFDALVLFSTPEDLKFIWLFFYVAVFLFLRGNREGRVWILALFASVVLLLAQPFHPLAFSYAQIVYLLFVLSVIMLIILFFQYTIDAGYKLIMEQKEMLKSFNTALEEQVAQKTGELLELNSLLEAKVEEKVQKVKSQEEMLIAQSRLAAMGEMLSMIAHQWRQPLATMTLMISNAKIKTMLMGKGVRESDKMLDEISDTIIYLSETIDDFQTYFKPEKKTEEVVSCDIVERAVSFARARYKMNGIELKVNRSECVEMQTYASEVVQVLINLLNNAADAIIERDSKHKLVTITSMASEEGVCIVVEDSGGGIDDDVLPKIFEPYFSTKSKNGTGLGLYMAKMIVETHIGGSITVENGKEGVIFKVTLPVHVHVTSSTDTASTATVQS